MDRVIVVGLGGFLGSVLRYLVSIWIYAWVGDRFPWATLAVNLVGCFVLGALAAVADAGPALGLNTRLFLFIGVIGGFTTFSAFGLETFALIQAGRLGSAGLSATLQLAGGLGSIWLGGLAMRGLVGS